LDEEGQPPGYKRRKSEGVAHIGVIRSEDLGSLREPTKMEGADVRHGEATVNGQQEAQSGIRRLV
jgi:hypothetical protein